MTAARNAVQTRAKSRPGLASDIRDKSVLISGRRSRNDCSSVLLFSFPSRSSPLPTSRSLRTRPLASERRIEGGDVRQGSAFHWPGGDIHGDGKASRRLANPCRAVGKIGRPPPSAIISHLNFPEIFSRDEEATLGIRQMRFLQDRASIR